MSFALKNEGNMYWEYRKINLNDQAHRSNEIDVLCQAGEHGWELVTILSNNIAYLKRELAERGVEEPEVERDHSATEKGPDGVLATVTRGVEAKVKYRDAATGDTWSGRGRMATWLKRKQDAGEDIEKYRT
jgi:DNA-binding protein H-NS